VRRGTREQRTGREGSPATGTRGEPAAATADTERRSRPTPHIDADDETDIRDKLLRTVSTRIPERFGLHPVLEVQILTPKNRGSLGTRGLNLLLQQRLNPGPAPAVCRAGARLQVGDKVMQTVNDYDRDVFNGDIGRIVEADPEAASLGVDFDGRSVRYGRGDLDALCLAYAVTVHKAQGSEFPAVVIPIAMQHDPLLERNLLYTAVTRGRRLVVVIGQTRALAIAVNNATPARRFTNLAARLGRGSSKRAAVRKGRRRGRSGRPRPRQQTWRVDRLRHRPRSTAIILEDRVASVSRSPFSMYPHPHARCGRRTP